jgi:hypothetical protein
MHGFLLPVKTLNERTESAQDRATSPQMKMAKTTTTNNNLRVLLKPGHWTHQPVQKQRHVKSGGARFREFGWHIGNYNFFINHLW